MKFTTIVLCILTVSIFSACSSTKKNTQTYWVSGMKTECAAGAGKMQCLNVYKGENLEEANWQNFYAKIEGFVFEEGYLKKLKVKEQKIDNPPADGSSIKYTMVKELEKRADYRVNVNGRWILNRINDAPIDRSVKLPEMGINLQQMQVSGTGGCNSYSGQINKLTSNTIQFGNIVSTQMACTNKHIEQQYFKAFNTVNTYQIKGDNLTFYDKNGNKVLSYMKKVEDKADPKIQDKWTAIRIMKNPINRMSPVPSMEINLTDMKVFGNDGCNDYSGAIKEVSGTQIMFGPVGSTRKMCPKMETADSFNAALSKVAAYTWEASNLILTDEKGEEIIAFMKGN